MVSSKVHFVHSVSVLGAPTMLSENAQSRSQKTFYEFVTVDEMVHVQGHQSINHYQRVAWTLYGTLIAHGHAFIFLEEERILC